MDKKKRWGDMHYNCQGVAFYTFYTAFLPSHFSPLIGWCILFNFINIITF